MFGICLAITWAGPSAARTPAPPPARRVLDAGIAVLMLVLVLAIMLVV